MVANFKCNSLSSMTLNTYLTWTCAHSDPDTTKVLVFLSMQFAKKNRALVVMQLNFGQFSF